MDKVLVIKDLVYGGGVTDLADAVANLADGEIGIYGAKNGLLLGALADASYVDEKEFVMAWNVGGKVRLTKPIRRKGIERFDKGDYVAPVFHKVSAGGTIAATSFGIDDADIGDVSIRVADNTFTGMYATSANNASVYKKASMTQEVTVDLLVAQLNANTSLPVTAVKIGADPNFGINIESTVRGQILSLTGEGLLEGMNRITDDTAPAVLPVIGNGVYEDVLEHEFQASTYQGNSNSRELTAEFYSQPNGAVVGATYKTIVFNEDLDRPYRGETNVKPLYTIYLPEAAATLNTDLLAIFQRLIEGAYTTVTAPEPGNA
tara:strand:+ start:72138 stop:73094 length:957 start_codon:yes stop_codon:yes gene_type:complete